MRRLGKKSRNASKCTKRWSDHEVEQLIDLLEENVCLWDVSNKDYYLRKKRERAHKQIEEKLRTERAAIKAKITNLRQQCWQLLRSFAYTTQQVPTSANNSQQCWAQQCCDLLRPFEWVLRPMQNERNIVGQQHPTLVGPTCCVRLHGTTTMLALVGTCCV